MVTWSQDPGNMQLVRRLQEGLAQGGRVLVFLGAGLSFGAARLGGRAQFDYPPRPWWPHDVPDQYPDDDELPLPSWPWLVRRMCREVMNRAPQGEHDSLRSFFAQEGPLDCAQLFRQIVGEATYRDFLQGQFDAGRQPFIQPTPSHQALVRLNLPLLFTTNYDELIESAYAAAGKLLRVSVDEDQFKAHRGGTDRPHLVKLHGSVDQPASIVLTRTDYAAARAGRKEMLDFLRGQMSAASFLFVGFSLSDPNFNLIHDDIRFVYGIDTPVSYTVQGRRDLVKQRYLSSLDVSTVWLDRWNDLPTFLEKISPAAPS